MKRWIAHGLSLAAVLVLLAPLAIEAQQAGTGTITGVVTAADTRQPLHNVTVAIEGSTMAAPTNEQGRYLFRNVPVGQRIVKVSLLGYATEQKTVTVAAGASVGADFELKFSAIQMKEVVVTALGQEQKARSIGTSMANINQVALERSPEVQLINTLAGQSPGVTVASSGGQPGASSRIVIRGESSFTGSGQPLFVLDGIPIAINLDNRNSGTGTLEFGNGGSRAMDIDPNNIEEITVLKGAAATALYGSQAAFGAIIIKTKQGTPGQPMRFSMRSSAGYNMPILGGKQIMYAQGSNGYFCNGVTSSQGGWCQPGFPGTNPNPQSNTQWGPHRDSIPQIIIDSIGQLRFRDPSKDFYINALTLTNSLNVTGSIPSGTYNLTLSHTDEHGIVPGGGLNRLNLGANLNTLLTSWLRSRTSMQYANTDNTQANEGYQGYTRTIAQLPLTRDITQAWMPDGSPVMWGTNSPHPEWGQLNSLNSSVVDRWTASQELNLTAIPGVAILARAGLDTYTDNRHAYANERPWQTQLGGTSGSSSQSLIGRRNVTGAFIVNVDRFGMDRFGLPQLGLYGLVGGEVRHQENSNVGVSGSDVLTPGSYNINNMNTQSQSGSLATMRRSMGVYSQFNVEWNNWAFITLTGRNDWSSTLPVDHNSYFYPSASLALIFSDALGIQSNLLNMGKLRLAWSRVGNDAEPYLLDTRYITASAPAASNSQQQSPCCGLSFPIPQQNGVAAYTISNTLGNPDLRPEAVVELEAGIELQMLDRRLRADVTVYDKKSYDQIFSVPSSPSTGFTQITRNAGDLRNKGIEVSLSGSPIRMRNLTWDITTNFARNKSSVVELAPGVASIAIAGYSWPQIRIMEGKPYGVIWGYGYKRNEQGERLIGDDGWPLPDDQLKVIGLSQPKWNGSLNNSLRYKGLTFTTLMSVNEGGDQLNFDIQYTGSGGQHKVTEKRGDIIVFEGVNVNTGQPNAVQIERNEAFWRKYVAFDSHEAMIETRSYVRLNEVGLSYLVPRKFIERYKLENLRINASARNLKVWTKNSKGDPDGSNYGSENAGGQAFSFFQAPQTRGFNLGLTIGF
jgi:TonB-linked SusC/RagA family outer membrane protein